MDLWNFVASVGASYLAKWWRNSESKEEFLPPLRDGGFGSEVSSDFMPRNNCCGDFRLRRGAWKFGKQRGFLFRPRDLRAVAAAKKPEFSVESCIGEDGGEFEKVFSISYLTSPVSSQTGHTSVTAGNRIVGRRGVSLPLLEFLCGDNAGLMQTDSALPNNRERFEHGCLLFSFGVVNGIIFTIMSSRREIERLRHLLSQTEALAQDLQEELEMRTSLTVKELTDEAHDCLETRQNLFNEEHGKRVASSYWKTTSVHKVEDMTSVEAELEAELEKLELNLHFSKHQTTFLRMNEA